MGSRKRENSVALHSDVPCDEERVRAVLAGWGLEENAIYRLLTEARADQTAAPQAGAKQPDETATLLHGGTLPRRYASH